MQRILRLRMVGRIGLPFVVALVLGVFLLPAHSVDASSTWGHEWYKQPISKCGDSQLGGYSKRLDDWDGVDWLSTGRYKYTLIRSAQNVNGSGTTTYYYKNEELREKRYAPDAGLKQWHRVHDTQCTKQTGSNSGGGSSECPNGGSATTRYGWTVVHRPARNGNKIAIANVKMQTRLCMSNGAITGLATNHQDYERFQVYVLDAQRSRWNATNSGGLTCGFSSHIVTCSGDVSVQARFSGSVTIALNFARQGLSGFISQFGFQIGGNAVMAAYNGNAYPEIMFRGNQYRAQNVFPTGTWVDVNTGTNGPICPSAAC